MIYLFEHDEINCCSNCPFFYDLIYCQIDEREKADYKDYTWQEDGKRPDWCPMVNLNEIERRFMADIVSNCGMVEFKGASQNG